MRIPPPAETSAESHQRASPRPEAAPEAPRLRGVPWFGHLPALGRDPIGVFMQAAALGHDLVRLPVANRDIYLLRRPEDVRYVLQEGRHNFSKQTRGYAALRLMLGNGLVTSEGDFWLRQRRLAQPAFHRQRIAGFAEKMMELTREMLERWENVAQRGESLDVASEMMQLTLRIVGWTLLSTEVGPDSPAVGRALNELLPQVLRRSLTILRLPNSLPTRKNRNLREARAALDRIVLRMITERRQRGGDGADLLGMLMSARDEETGEAMSDAQLRDEVMTIFLAGHETTANALTWTLFLLSRHPDVRRRLEQEVAEALQGRAPTALDLPKLGYALAVVQESMRLYPPVWLLMRRCESDDVIAGYRVPARAFIAVSPLIIHRDPKLFENPEGFDPERFLGERLAQIPRFGYLPFSAGPRVCIGNSFALMEAQLVLASIAQRFRLDLVPGHRVEPHPAVTLRPRYGMRMIVHRAR